MRYAGAAVGVALLVFTVAVVGVIREARKQSDSVQAAAEQIMRTSKEMAEPQTLTTSWTDERNAKHEVKTSRAPGEEMGDWTTRHQEAVDALQAIYPPAA